MDSIVSLCKRRGFVFQSSEIYGGIQGFWDYGPLGTELKRNVRDAWYHDMVTRHDELSVPAGAPQSFSMCGIESSIVMHPQVWKCSGHYDLFHDWMVDCKGCKSRFRLDHITVALLQLVTDNTPVACETYMKDATTGMGLSKAKAGRLDKALKRHNQESGTEATGEVLEVSLDQYLQQIQSGQIPATPELAPKCPECSGELTAPREFNLMLKTVLGALSSEEEGTAYLRPETAQGMFVNYRNVVDSSRVKVPFGIAQIGKSFRNEITPRNFTFRSREFEQMEMEFFCHPSESPQWYQYWRDRRFRWYTELGIAADNLIMREHTPEELAHYSVGTADVEYAFPFLDEGEYGELEGIAHRGDFDLRSHMEGKLVNRDDELVVEQNEHGQPKYRGSGKDLTWFDDQTRERFIPHVIEPAAGADRTTLAFLCEAFHEDEQPDEKGKLQKRAVLQLHPRLAPYKVAVFPLVKKGEMRETAVDLYRELKAAGIMATYDQQGAIGRRYRRQDEIGTPWCLTVDGDTADDGCVTIRDRDTLQQERVPLPEVVERISSQLRG